MGLEVSRKKGSSHGQGWSQSMGDIMCLYAPGLDTPGWDDTEDETQVYPPGSNIFLEGGLYVITDTSGPEEDDHYRISGFGAIAYLGTTARVTIRTEGDCELFIKYVHHCRNLEVEGVQIGLVEGSMVLARDSVIGEHRGHMETMDRCLLRENKGSIDYAFQSTIEHQKGHIRSFSGFVQTLHRGGFIEGAYGALFHKSKGFGKKHPGWAVGVAYSCHQTGAGDLSPLVWRTWKGNGAAHPPGWGDYYTTKPISAPLATPRS